MKRMKRWMGLVGCLFITAVVMVPLSSAADAPAMVVGRIYHIEGDLLRYVPEEKDWVAVVRDAPFGTEDTLFSGSRGMAELIAPNGTWIRIGNSTQIQVIALDTDLAEMDVDSGVARFYNKSSDTLIKVTSPFGYVLGGLRLLRGRKLRGSGRGEGESEFRPLGNCGQIRRGFRIPVNPRRPAAGVVRRRNRRS